MRRKTRSYAGLRQVGLYTINPRICREAKSGAHIRQTLMFRGNGCVLNLSNAHAFSALAFARTEQFQRSRSIAGRSARSARPIIVGLREGKAQAAAGSGDVFVMPVAIIIPLA